MTWGTETMNAVAPPGGMVKSIEAPALQFPSWRDGICAGAPATKRSSKEWDAEECFSPAIDHHAHPRLTLMWPGKVREMSPLGAVDWAKDYGLRETHPLEVFALSAASPRLFQELMLEGVGLAPTEFGEHRRRPHICGVWQSWRRQERVAVLRPANGALLDKTIFVFGEPAGS